MAQHFLLSKEARSLSLKSIYQNGEDAARETFKRIRWEVTGGEPVCPAWTRPAHDERYRQAHGQGAAPDAGYRACNANCAENSR